MRPARMWATAAAKAATPEMPMFAPGAGGGGGGDQQHGREADVAEHEAEARRRRGDDEAPDAEGDELEGVHRSGSLARLRDVNGTPGEPSENHSHLCMLRHPCVRSPRPRPPSPVLLLAAGCGDSGSGGDASVTAVATTTQVADLVRNVGESASRSTHPAAQLRPARVRAAAQRRGRAGKADLVFRSGGDLDEWLDEMVDSAGGDARQVTLIDSVNAGSGDDPHWWQDPRNAIPRRRGEPRRARRCRPRPSCGLRALRAAAYVGQLRARSTPTRAMRRPRAATSARSSRRHDALGYFADRYGVKVIGAVIPSLSTQAQASAS